MAPRRKRARRCGRSTRTTGNGATASAPKTLPPEALRNAAASPEDEAEGRDRNEDSRAFPRERPTFDVRGRRSGEAAKGTRKRSLWAVPLDGMVGQYGKIAKAAKGLHAFFLSILNLIEICATD